MLGGAHAIIFTKDAAADRAFLRDVLGLRSVDDGGGWLIFALPPAELSVHPAEENGRQAVYLMCDDAQRFAAEMKTRGVPCSDLREQQWGRVVEVTLPSGARLGVYQPRHARP